MQKFIFLKLISFSMRWLTESYEILKKNFGEKIFTSSEAFNLLNNVKNYNKPNVNSILYNLYLNESLVRLGRGIYRINLIKIKQEEMISVVDSIGMSDSLTIRIVPGPLVTAQKQLSEKGIEYMITGGSVLFQYIHHYPRYLIHLIYVIKGGGEYAAFSLRELNLKTLLNPKFIEIKSTLDNFTERDIFIVREFNHLSGNVNNVATIEKAIIDLYFETTRKKIPYSGEELGRIISQLVKNEPINLSSLYMYAEDRGVRKEIRAIFKNFYPEIDADNLYSNKFVNDVIKGINMENLR